MIAPIVTARMKEVYQDTCFRIDPSQVVPFVKSMLDTSARSTTPPRLGLSLLIAEYNNLRLVSCTPFGVEANAWRDPRRITPHVRRAFLVRVFERLWTIGLCPGAGSAVRAHRESRRRALLQ